ncbi:MAG: class I SAM-dependent methyltransferase [Acidithiobacillus sp.]
MKSNSKLGIGMNEQQYADHWTQSSHQHALEGVYHQISEYTKEAKNVLEIGCGAGYGTLALAADTNRRLVSVDCSSIMLKLTEKRLHENSRSSIWLPNNTALEIESNSSISLIERNILDIDILKVFGDVRFDAIICWLIGGYPSVIGDAVGKDWRDFDGTEMEEYRRSIHKRCYDIGCILLNNGGVVHIVDRGALFSWNDKDYVRNELVSIHDELSLGKYFIEREDVWIIRYSAAKSGVPVGSMDPRIVPKINVLTSVLAKKKF